MSFIAAAVIVGGAAVASAALSKGGGDKKVGFTEPEQSAEARRLSIELGTESVKFPGRRIADLSQTEIEVERQVQQLLKAGPSPEREAVLQELLKTATADVTEDPQLQAIFAKITEAGQLEANRLGRGLQISGAAGSTPGRDILGRSVTDVQERLTAAAFPFLALKQQAGRDVSNIISQRFGEKTTALGLGGAVGQLRRGIEQSKLDIELEDFIRDINFRFGTQANILAGAQVQPTAVVSGGGPSTGQQIAGGVQSLLPLLLLGGGGGGGGGNFIPTPASVIPGLGPSLASAFPG